MKQFPALATYVRNMKEVNLAATAGVTHFILEDPYYSLNPFSDINTAGKIDINSLSTKIKQMDPSHTISLNMNKMLHESELFDFRKYISTLKGLPIDYFRAQDIGLAQLIKDITPTSRLTFCTFTGNNNLESIKFLFKNPSLRFDCQLLSQELSSDDLIKITTTCKTYNFEYQVHGPILLQYSKRKLKASFEKHLELESKISFIQDPERAHSYFPIYENIHGHFIFFHKSLALINQVDKLLNLNLQTWIIDCRDLCIENYSHVLNLYHEALNGNKSKFHEIQNTTEGFFNKDIAIANTYGINNNKIVARVIDVNKPKFLLIKLKSNIKLGQNFQLQTPENKTQTFILKSIFDIEYNELKEAYAGDIVFIPWIKGSQVQSYLS